MTRNSENQPFQLKVKPFISHIEEIVIDGDDSIFGYRTSTFTSEVPNTVHHNMEGEIPEIHTREEAQVIAEYILEVLEEDLNNYLTETCEDEIKVKYCLHSESNISIDSSCSLPLSEEPSTMKLEYEEESNDYMPKIPNEAEMVDKSFEVKLHRKHVNAFTLTREMTFLDPLTAELVFRHNYPQSDDYKPPEKPSRTHSLALVLEKAAEEDPKVDRPRIGPKIKWGKGTRLLPPLPQDYFKKETFWTGSVFKGQYKHRDFQHGKFEYPLMSTYESEFKNGHIHTEKHLGCVTYPRGDKFEGEWVKGNHVSGKITFADGLEFDQKNWGYCKAPDRRFQIEKDIGLKQAGKTLFNNWFPPPNIPPGHYDTGYGIFNPETGEMRGYNGEKLRDVTYPECKWIISTCRRVKNVEEHYKPSFNSNRIPVSTVENFVKQ